VKIEEENAVPKSLITKVGYAIAGLLICTAAVAIDCTKALNPVETAICANKELVQLDAELNEVYLAALKSARDPKKLREDAANWIRGRNQIDPAKPDEIKAAYQMWIAAVRATGPADVSRRSAVADGPAAPKLKRIREIVSHQPLYLRNERGNAAPWCPAFLDQLRQGDAKIEVIEPAFRTEDKNDARLRHYNTCASGGERREYLEKALSDDSTANFWGVQYIGHRSFRLYKLPDPARHKTVEVVYAELNKGEGLSNQFPGYSIVKLDQCSFEQMINIKQSLRYYENRTLENHNAIVKYRGNYYVVDLYDDRAISDTESAYGMVIEPIFEKKPRFCRWTHSKPR